jgi:hypothetical protein
MTAVGAMATIGFRRWPPFLELDLLRDPQRVVDLDPKISDGALQIGVAKEDLDGSKVSGLLVDEGCLGSSHRMRSIGARLKANAPDPALNNACILSSGEMGRLTTPAREQVTPSSSLHRWEPCGEGGFRLFSHFELDGTFCLLLDNCRSIPDRASGPKVLNSQSDEVTRAKLAVDREIEQGSSLVAPLISRRTRIDHTFLG